MELYRGQLVPTFETPAAFLRALEESEERLRRELEAERARKAREVKQGVVSGEAARGAEQLMAKSRRALG